VPVAEINGIELYYESHGPSEGDPPTIVLLHGAAGNHISWWQQVPHFRDAYRCVTIDHRGFGRSHDATGEGGTRFVDDLEALLGELGVERAALVAQSMGGRTALGFAVRHPDRVSALVMADTWGFFDWPELIEERERMRSQPGATAPLEQRALGSAFQRKHPRLRFLYEQIAGLNPPRPQQLLQPEGAPTKDEVAALTVPVLFIVGSEDPLTPPSVLQRVHDLIEGSEYREFPALGHSVYFEDPAGFNEAVGEFIGRERE
jgi:pimeloyl-ACP methyl ester carboxylesterase